MFCLKGKLCPVFKTRNTDDNEILHIAQALSLENMQVCVSEVLADGRVGAPEC